MTGDENEKEMEMLAVPWPLYGSVYLRLCRDRDLGVCGDEKKLSHFPGQKYGAGG